MRVLIIHNQLWAHYKSRLFSDIYNVMKETGRKDDFLVAQIALHEASRKVMQNNEEITYDYPYQVLFNRSLDTVDFGERRKALFKIFKEFNPDVLNITGYSDWAQVLLMFYAKSKGVKVVISSESSSLDHNRSGWKEALKGFIVGRANAFFCFGKTSADYLKSLGVKPELIAVTNAAVIDGETIRNTYDEAKKQLTEQSQGSERIRKFVYVGRLAPEKNLEMLVRAFKGVIAKGSEHAEWELMLVGDGPSRSGLEELVASLRLQSKVSFAGGFPWYEVPSMLAQSDVLVLPSKSEPWGLVVNEAMVCEMPVIVSKNCGCVEDLVKQDVNGFIFDPENQNELEEAMAHFIANPKKVVSMGIASRKLIAPFSSPTVAAQMVESYEQLLKA